MERSSPRSDEPSLREASEALVERGVEAIAVVLLHAYINPAHEVRCEELLRSWYPKLSISLSHRIANEWREYERTSTTVVNAAVAPTVDSYLRDLESRVRAEGVDASIHIMQSNGGMTTASRARRQPVNTLLSGPVGGAIAASHACRQEGFKRAIAVDMGGTSFDVSLIVGGEPQLAREAALEGQPLLIPVIDVHSIGSGGGSIAWSSAGGLRVGPKSAGALPGPACYGRGGIEPTVTDANVYLNRVNADYFLGGAMHLQADRAADALDRLGRDLELKPEPLAAGIIDVVDSRMAGLIRQITVGRGLDPREFALIAFGGAGPMHAVALAEELGITTVLVPYSPGTLSAQGMLVADISHDVVRPYFSRWDRLDHAEIEALVEEMRADGRALLAEDGVRQRDASFHFSADLRYAGQEHSLTLRFKRLDEPTLRRFHRTYRRTFGHANPQEFVELVAVRMTTTGRNRRPFDVGVVEDGEGKPYTFQEVLFRQHRRVTTPRFRRGDLYRGQHLSGPLVVDEASCTTVVPDGWDVYVGESGFMRLQRKG